MPETIGAIAGSIALAATANATLAVSATAFQIATALGVAAGNAAIGLGVSVVAGALTGRPGGGKVKPSDAQQAFRNPVQARLKSYGRVRVAGAQFWLQADEVDGILFHGVALNHGRIGAFVAFHLDDKEITLDDGDNGAIETPPFDTLETAEVETRYGEDEEEPYAPLEDVFGYDNVRGDGVASLLARFDSFEDANKQLENFVNGLPRLKATIDATVCFIVRDPECDPYDRSTWEYSDNPVDVLVTHLLDRDGYAIAWSKIEPNLSEIRAQADICDEEVLSPAGGGTEKRYRLAGTFTFLDRPTDVAARMVAAMDGRCWQKSDGTIGILAGRYQTPEVTIGRDNIIAYDMHRGQDGLFAIAGIRAQYMSPAHDYREQDAEPWPDGEAVMDLEDERVANLDLEWVPSHGQARRLMKRAFTRATAPWHGTVHTDMVGLLALDQRYIALDLPELGIEVGSFEVSKVTFDPMRMMASIDVVAVDASIDAFSPEEEGTAPAIPEGLVWIEKDDGEGIGNFNLDGRVFDGDTVEASGACAFRGQTNGYIGKTFEEPKRFGKAIVYGSSNVGFFSPVSSPGVGSVTLIIRGKNGAPPSSRADGVNLGSVTFANMADESAGREIISTDTTTPYDHLWLDIEASSVTLYVAEIDWWEFAS